LQAKERGAVLGGLPPYGFRQDLRPRSSPEYAECDYP
jgi:hypothetical protein